MKSIWLIANGTFGEAIRRRTLLVFLLVVAVIIIAGAASLSLQPGHDAINTLGLGVILLTGVVISVIIGINLLPTEIERRTVYTILSKPVHRYQFLCGKFLGGLMTVLSSVGLMAFVFLTLVVIQERGFDKAVGDAAKGLVLIVFAITLVSAIAMFFSVFVSPFVNFFLTLAIYLLGCASSVTKALADPTSDPTQHKSIIVVDIFKVVHAVIPNFANYNVQNKILTPEVTIGPNFLSYNILYAVAYSMLLLTIASLVFSRREV